MTELIYTRVLSKELTHFVHHCYTKQEEIPAMRKEYIFARQVAMDIIDEIIGNS